MKAMNISSDRLLADRLVAATSLFSRMKGLLGRTSLQAGEGLWIRPCKSIHTIGMKFPIDVIFLDRGNRVIATLADLKPGRLSPFHSAAAGVIELPAGTIEDTGSAVGDLIDITP